MLMPVVYIYCGTGGIGTNYADADRVCTFVAVRMASGRTMRMPIVHIYYDIRRGSKLERP